MKKFLFAIPVVLLVVGVLIWRFMNPSLTDEQQIVANIQGMVTAANNRSAKNVVWYLVPDFQILGMKRGALQNQLAGGFLQYSVVELKTSDETVSINNGEAHSSGRYTLSLKREFNSQPEISEGEFDLFWKKVDGEWKVFDVQGIPSNLPME